MNDQVKNEQLELLQTFDAVLQLVQNPAGFSEAEADQIILDGHKVLNQALLKEEQTNPTVFVIYSANEAASNHDKGFWSHAHNAWVDTTELTAEDFYLKDALTVIAMPPSTGNDAVPVPAHQFGLLEIQRPL